MSCVPFYLPPFISRTPVELAEDYGRQALSADGQVAAAVARDRTVAVWPVGE
jgi:hypothetical protein